MIEWPYSCSTRMLGVQLLVRVSDVSACRLGCATPGTGPSWCIVHTLVYFLIPAHLVFGDIHGFAIGSLLSVKVGKNVNASQEGITGVHWLNPLMMVRLPSMSRTVVSTSS